jgi:hypothetical protein
MLAMLRKEWLALFRWKKLPETILMLAALTAPNLLLTDPKRFPLLFLDFPLLVLAVFRLGLPGATIGVVLMTIPITHYAVNNEGIFALQIYPNNAPRILILQGYFFLQLLMVNLTSSVLAERKRLEQALRSSEERFRGGAFLGYHSAHKHQRLSRIRVTIRLRNDRVVCGRTHWQPLSPASASRRPKQS